MEEQGRHPKWEKSSRRIPTFDTDAFNVLEARVASIQDVLNYLLEIAARYRGAATIDVHSAVIAPPFVVVVELRVFDTMVLNI